MGGRRWCSASTRSGSSWTARWSKGCDSGGGFTGLTSGREATDLSPDYVFQSKGRVTGTGYEVEVSIPFKSLRYQSHRSAGLGAERDARDAVARHRGQLDAGPPRRARRS